MKRIIRSAAVHVAIAAMLLRALLPAGWMPSAEAGTPITICTMNGPMQIVLGHDGQPLKQKPGDTRHHAACPFAAAPHMALATPVALFAPPQPASTGTSAHSKTADRIALYAPQAPRAPPILA